VDLDYEAYFFISANSGKAISSYHFIHNIETIDLDTRIEDYTIKKSKNEEFKQVVSISLIDSIIGN
jgi:hypothetical protein